MWCLKNKPFAFLYQRGGATRSSGRVVWWVGKLTNIVDCKTGTVAGKDLYGIQHAEGGGGKQGVVFMARGVGVGGVTEWLPGVVCLGERRAVKLLCLRGRLLCLPGPPLRTPRFMLLRARFTLFRLGWSERLEILDNLKGIFSEVTEMNKVNEGGKKRCAWVTNKGKKARKRSWKKKWSGMFSEVIHRERKAVNEGAEKVRVGVTGNEIT